PPTVLEPPKPKPEDGPEVVGPFQVRGWLGERHGVRLALGEDIVLGRRGAGGLLAARGEAGPGRGGGGGPPAPPPPPAGRRGRRGRAGGGGDGGPGGASRARRGGPLAALVSRTHPLTWPEARPILEALVEELCAAGADGTLPPRLHPEQVWVQTDGSPL